MAKVNQKVFIPLVSVLDLQERYLQTITQAEKDYHEGIKPHGNSYTLERKRTIEEIIDLLGLPITLRSCKYESDEESD
jgi:hypothetical protein